MDEQHLDILLRLGAATAVGMAIGLNRDVNGKPTGMRTLGLVSLGAALISLATVHYKDLDAHPDALSRVVQGLIQGVLTGVGFIGAGVILRRPDSMTVHGLTTAATVWVTASLGIACALAAWTTVAIGAAVTLVLLALGRPLDRLFGSSEEEDKGRADRKTAADAAAEKDGPS